eukprot:evm.model.scf_363.4 EVM.evm.TU.scf_363.4   scf_363:31311-36976(+)
MVATSLPRSALEAGAPCHRKGQRPGHPARFATSLPGPLRGSTPPQIDTIQQPPDYAAETRPNSSIGAGASGSEGGSTYAPDVPKYSREFLTRRFIVFAGIIVGYSCYYLTRNSLGFAAPVMVADKSLNMDITNIGALTSIFPIFYGFSKFASGVLGARTPAHILLGSGLIATAAVNICFGFGTSLAWFSVFWAMNGLLQGLGGPCCARVLTNWWASGERGTYWGMWNIAHNVGGFLAPIIVGTVATKFGWRWGLWTPGVIGVIVGLAVLFAVQDNPTSLGYPAVEESVKEEKPTEDGTAGDKPSLLDLLIQNVLKNPYIWGMALTYFFIYVIRQGVTSWFVFYLITAKGVGDAGSAAVRVSGMELGGLVGSLIAGRFSDWMILHAKPGQGAVGKRVQVVMMYTLGVAVALFSFWSLPGNLPWLQWINVFMVGFFLYGPQMLIGLCGAELVGPESVGASEGFLGWVAYLGAANAGIPLSILVKSFGWSYYFGALIAACGGALLLLAPMMNLKSHVQREEAKLKLKPA